MVRRVATHRTAAPSRDTASPALLPGRRRSESSGTDPRHSVGNLGVQRSLAGATPRAPSSAAARHACAVQAIAFPHAPALRQSLGTAAPLRAVLDASGCATRGVPAYTAGDVTHFAAPDPTLHVAAHEAAHQLQHAGVSNDGGLGAEGHAHAVANAVQRGRSARGLIGTNGRRVASAERRYTLDPTMPGWRIADTGESATNLSHTGYATAALIAQANAILSARRSGVEIKPGAGSKTVTAEDGTAKSLTGFTVRRDVDPTGDTFNSDCREAAREIMGGKGLDDAQTQDRALITPGGATAPVAVDAPEKIIDMVAKALYVDECIRKHPNYSALTDDEKRAFLQKCRDDFEWLSKEEVERYRKQAKSDAEAKSLGIDTHAAPGVGEAYAVFPADRAGKDQFKFHFAAVIMAPGADRVAMENDNGEPGQKSAAWRIDTYGTQKPGQSFHEQHKNFGDERHTLVMTNQPAPPPTGDAIRKTATASLFPMYEASTDANEKAYIHQELAFRRVSAEIMVHTQEDWTGDDEVFVDFSGAQTGTQRIKEGTTGTVTLQASRLVPLSGNLSVKVYEYDLLDPNDLIGTILWPSPWSNLTTGVAAGRANYTVTLRM